MMALTRNRMGLFEKSLDKIYHDIMKSLHSLFYVLYVIILCFAKVFVKWGKRIRFLKNQMHTKEDFRSKQNRAWEEENYFWKTV